MVEVANSALSILRVIYITQVFCYFNPGSRYGVRPEITQSPCCLFGYPLANPDAKPGIATNHKYQCHSWILTTALAGIIPPARAVVLRWYNIIHGDVLTEKLFNM